MRQSSLYYQDTGARNWRAVCAERCLHGSEGGGRKRAVRYLVGPLPYRVFVSPRQLMRHAADRLSVRWFLGYDLGESLPDHSSLTKIRTRYGLEVFRRFFEAIVEQGQTAGLIWGRELYVDGTKVAAAAGKESVRPRFAVEAHLSSLFDTQTEAPVDEEEQQQIAGDR
jgi:transposase-like protein DUF772